MYSQALLCLLPLVSAYVVPDEAIAQELLRQDGSRGSEPWLNVDCSELEDSFKYWLNRAEAKSNDYLEEAYSVSRNVVDTYEDVANTATSYFNEAAENLDSYLSELNEINFLDDEDVLDDLQPDWRPRRPGHGGHRHRPNLTVYQLIAKSRYTTKLAELINEYPDLVDALNGTEANYTIFAPTDRAFAKIPHHGDKKPSKEQLKALLTYHVSPKFYPAGRIFLSRTIPTLLTSEELGTDPLPQRLATEVSFKGLTVNFYSRVVAADIFGTNGVIHGVDSILLPPPRALTIIQLLPGQFSTLELALAKTGLLDELEKGKGHGGTLFAPGNRAWGNLDARLTAYLFSPDGRKYLKALLKYHLVPDITLYSDALYPPPEHKDSKEPSTSSGRYQVELPTLLEDHTLLVTISRLGRLINLSVNDVSRVEVSDGVARDGVIHTITEVLIPPKKLADGTLERYTGGPLEVDELKERLEPFILESDSALDSEAEFEL